MWPQVLHEARYLPHDRYTYAANHAVNRALYETGRLPDEMFCYPQHHLSFMLGWGIRECIPGDIFYWLRLRSFFQLGDLTLQLGLVNAAEHETQEAREILGSYPLIIKQLALTNIARGQPEAAKVFLRALTRYIHYEAWAKDALRRLEADPLWSTDPQIQHIRSVMPQRESLIIGVSLENTFDELLRANPRNRMTFEYRMAFYLLNRNVEKFVGELDSLDDFDYTNIPRLYEEAILTYEYNFGQKLDLRGRQISPQTRRAFREFLAWCGPDRQGELEVLRKRFGHTYFFYYSFARPEAADG